MKRDWYIIIEDESGQNDVVVVRAEYISKLDNTTFMLDYITSITFERHTVKKVLNYYPRESDFID